MNDVNAPRDEQLVALIAQQQPVLRAIIRSLMPTGGDCEDVLQQTNLVLWQKRDSYQIETNFNAWASTIARFQVMAWRKRSKRNRSMSFDPTLMERIAAVAGERFEALPLRREALQKCLQELPAEHRQLLDHRYRDRAPLVDFAKRSGRTYAAVAKLLERVRTRLRNCIDLRLANEGAQ